MIYRANFVPTMFAARQFISHKHIEVNGKIVNIASYQLKIGDVVTIKEKSRRFINCLGDYAKKGKRYSRLFRSRLQAMFSKVVIFTWS